MSETYEGVKQRLLDGIKCSFFDIKHPAFIRYERELKALSINEERKIAGELIKEMLENIAKNKKGRRSKKGCLVQLAQSSILEELLKILGVKK